MDKEDWLLIAVISIPLYLFVLHTPLTDSSNPCSFEEGQSTKSELCVTDYVETSVTKEYLGVLQLPVYKAGYNIEWLHYLFAVVFTAVSTITLKKYASAYK